jgi:asparagine synthase (glutamine-hydrolysing)
MTDMSRYYDKRITTFSLVYRQDETKRPSFFNKKADHYYGRLMANRFGTEHVEVEASLENLPDDLTEILRCVDEPFSGAFTYFYLSRFSQNYVKSVLSGDGGDEHFGSYRSHLMAYPIYYYNKTLALQGTVRDKDAAWLDGFDLNYVAKIAEENEWDWRIKLNVFDDQEKSSMYSKETLSRVGKTSTVDWYRSEFNKCVSKTPLNRMLEMELKTKFSSEMMTLVDRFNMVHSVECRCPLADHRLMEFTSKLPDKLKIKNGDARYIYKKALKRLLPDQMINRGKEGLIMPVYDEILGEKYRWARQVLCDEKIREYNIFDSSKINSFLDGKERDSNPYQYAQKVWNLVVLQTWLNDNFG